jgi:hypothetical protein
MSLIAIDEAPRWQVRFSLYGETSPLPIFARGWCLQQAKQDAIGCIRYAYGDKAAQNATLVRLVRIAD